MVSQLSRGLLRQVPDSTCSNMGRISRGKRPYTFGTQDKSGRFCMVIDGSNMYMHKLVMWSFDGLPAKDETQVDHKSGVTSDNRRCNLEYVTPSENVRRSYSTNSARHRGKSNGKRVKASMDGFERVFESITDAATQLKVCGSNISACCNGKRKRVKGYKFEYEIYDNLNGEEWRDAVGFEKCIRSGLVPRVSSLGRFKDCYGCVRTPPRRETGYSAVSIYNKQYRMNILVATAFELQRLPGQDEVDHINGLDVEWPDAVENLRWVDHSTNIRSSYENLGRKSSGDSSAPKLQCKLTTDDDWTSYPSASCVQRCLGIDDTAISRYLKALCDGIQPKPIYGKYELRYDKTFNSDLAGEIWKPLLVPTVLPTTTFQPLDDLRLGASKNQSRLSK